MLGQRSPQDHNPCWPACLTPEDEWACYQEKKTADPDLSEVAERAASASGSEMTAAHTSTAGIEGATEPGSGSAVAGIAHGDHASGAYGVTTQCSRGRAGP